MNKRELSNKLNEELDDKLFRFEKIIGYYEDNPEQLKAHLERDKNWNRLELGNLKYVDALVKEFYNLSDNIKDRYGVVLHNCYKQWTDLNSRVSRNIWFLREDNGLEVDQEIIERYGCLNGRVGSLKQKIYDIENKNWRKKTKIFELEKNLGSKNE